MKARTSPDLFANIKILVVRSTTAYTLLAFLPALPLIKAQLPQTAAWWAIVFGGVLIGSAAAMVTLSARGRPVRVPALLYAAAMFGGTATGPFAFAPTSHSQPWLWWGVGPAVVLVGLVLGGPVAATYAVVLGGLYALLRPTAAFGSADTMTAVSEAVFAPVSSLAVLAVALGMLRAARAADQLADRVYGNQLAEAVEREVGEARTQLDRLIHDDVMTTLTSLAQADDIATATATAALARETLERIDALQSSSRPTGDLAVGVIVQMARETTRRVSPRVNFIDRTTPIDRRQHLPAATAEALLSSLREAVRNAARHAAAGQIVVTWEGATEARSTQVRVIIHDDGHGFDPELVPAERLGIALSIQRPMTAAGGSAQITSAPGTGTTITLISPCRSAASLRSPGGARRADDRPRLPVDFPVESLVRICWVIVAIGVVLGLLNLGRVSPIWPALAAMPLMCLLAHVTLRRGSSLQLNHPQATTAVVLIASITALVCSGLPRDQWPDAAIFWFTFPTQLILAALVVRRRAAHALSALILLSAISAVWAQRSVDSTSEFLNAVFGPVAFFVIAVAVSQILHQIGARRAELRVVEKASIEQSARRYAAVIQRSLWLADLKAITRGPLLEIMEAAAPPPPDLVERALLLEAKLREAVLARNVMSDELADLTEDARRRGVNIVFVDSRHSPLPREVGQTVVTEVRQVLTSATVSRMVVRLAPGGGSQAATIVSNHLASTRMTAIDSTGERVATTGKGP